MKLHIILAALAVMAAGSAAAQERSAGQAYDAQVNWASLKGMFDKIDAQNKVLAATLAQVSACNSQKKFYAPSDPAAVSPTYCVGIDTKQLKFKTASFAKPYGCGGASTACRADQVTVDHQCEINGYNGASGFGVGSYSSPGNNVLGHWDGTKYALQSASAAGNRWISSYTCYSLSYGPSTGSAD